MTADEKEMVCARILDMLCTKLGYDNIKFRLYPDRMVEIKFCKCGYGYTSLYQQGYPLAVNNHLTYRYTHILNELLSQCNEHYPYVCAKVKLNHNSNNYYFGQLTPIIAPGTTFEQLLIMLDLEVKDE